jgi:carbon-monoxide dehydrogenase small subunit
MDDEPILSCLTLAIRCDHKNITTIEGLAQKGKLHPVQESAMKHNAAQCGYCTPGWILSAKALLDSNPHPTRADIQHAIAGNLCRCTGYKRIEETIIDAADSNSDC